MGFRRQLIGAAGVILAGVISAGCDGSTPLGGRSEAVADMSAVAATVNGSPIYVSDVQIEAEVQNLVSRGARLEVDSAEFNQILDDLIDQKLLAMEAEARGLDEEPLARHRLEFARQNILGNILIDAVVAERIGEAEIRRMYDAQIAIWELGDEVRVRHILALTKEEIDSIAAEVRAGADFAVVASRRSVDDATRMDGGDLGYMTEADASPEFGRIIRSTQVGGVSRPFETEMGWHIVKIEERRKERPPSLEQLRAPILQHLTMIQIGDVLRELRTSGRIQKLTSPQNSALEFDAFRAVPEAAAPQRAPEPNPDRREPDAASDADGDASP